MAKKDIIIWPDPILKQISKPVRDFSSSDFKNNAQDLLDTFHSEPMAGLSAPQIGVNLRFFVADIPPDQNDGNGTDGLEFFINPEIISKSGSLTFEEGCMSIPGFKGNVKRSANITLKYFDLTGKEKQIDAIDYLAVCIQHEIDHLDGILWVDHQSSFKRNFIEKKMLKLKKLPKDEQNWSNFR